tara:strand:- start:5317 stop:5607 length:291 start_codon:yes stop_codon:yes gene_type:complete
LIDQTEAVYDRPTIQHGAGSNHSVGTNFTMISKERTKFSRSRMYDCSLMKNGDRRIGHFIPIVRNHRSGFNIRSPADDAVSYKIQMCQFCVGEEER